MFGFWCFDKIIISSDDSFFEDLVNCKEIEFIKRTENLTGDDATTDMDIDYFSEKLPFSETILWVKSVSRLQ